MNEKNPNKKKIEYLRKVEELINKMIPAVTQLIEFHFSIDSIEKNTSGTALSDGQNILQEIEYFNKSMLQLAQQYPDEHKTYYRERTDYPTRFSIIVGNLNRHCQALAQVLTQYNNGDNKYSLQNNKNNAIQKLSEVQSDIAQFIREEKENLKVTEEDISLKSQQEQNSSSLQESEPMTLPERPLSTEINDENETVIKERSEKKDDVNEITIEATPDDIVSSLQKLTKDCLKEIGFFRDARKVLKGLNKVFDSIDNDTPEKKIRKFYEYLEKETDGKTNLDIIHDDKSRATGRFIAGIAAIAAIILTLPLGLAVMAIVKKVTGKLPGDLLKPHKAGEGFASTMKIRKESDLNIASKSMKNEEDEQNSNFNKKNIF